MPEMPQDSLRAAIDAIRTRLHDELEAQLTHLSARHEEELDGAWRTAEAEAEQRWSSKVEDVRSEWTGRLEAELSAARAEAERRLVAESMRLRVEAEQAAAGSAAAVREELEQALATERDRAQADLDAERQRSTAEREQRQGELDAARQELERICQERDSFRQELEAVRQQTSDLRSELETGRQETTAARQESNRAHQEADSLQRELESARQQLGAAQQQLTAGNVALASTRNELDAARRAREEATQAYQALSSKVDQDRRARDEDARRQAEAARAMDEDRVAERQAQLAVVERLLTAIRLMDGGRSLTDVLSALTSAAAAEAPRVALFVVNGSELRGWKTIGFETDTLLASLEDKGLLGEVMRRREPVVSAEGDGPSAPAFAALPSDRAAIAVPLMVASQPVAVLYADDASDGPPETPASWPEAVQILGRHASINLAHLTAARAAEVMRRSMAPAAGAAPARPEQAEKEDGTSARRYARLLVSEIKLYNEAAVRLGRQNRDLLERLKPEIERARKLYTQRISPAVDARGALFQQELVQTLADGDASLLGNPA
jgi:predicted  nucleic acid-binding Zn-ribbon protein